MNYTFLRFPDFKYKAVTLSYDDDVVYDKKLIEIIDKYGLKCTFNLNSGFFAEKSGGRMMTEEEAKELFGKSEHEIAVHGVSHLSLAEHSREAIAGDILLDRLSLETLFGRIIKGMAYANGSYDDKTAEVLKSCGIKYARTVNSSEKFDIPTDWLRLSPTCHHGNPRLNELTDEFLKDYGKEVHYKYANPKLFYLWGHAYEFNDNNEWDILENFCKKTGGRDDVWYATNGEIYDYVKAFDRLEFSVGEDLIKNPSAIDLYLNFYGEKVFVPASGTVRVSPKNSTLSALIKRFSTKK